MADVSVLGEEDLADQTQVCDEIGGQQHAERSPRGERYFFVGAKSCNAFPYGRKASEKQAGKTDQHQRGGDAVEQDQQVIFTA